MAWIIYKEKRAYLYERIDGKARCVKPLGVIGPREAEDARIKWLADEGRDSANVSDRSMDSLWNEWMQYMIDENYSEKTIKCQHDCVEPFVRTMHRLRELTTAKCESWDLVLKTWTYRKGPNAPDRRLATETRAHRLRAISSFCAWIVGQKYLKKTPFEVQIPAQRKDAGRALMGSDVRKLFDNWPKGRNTEKQRCAALSKIFFQIVFFGGTRLTETLGESDDSPGATHENLDRERCILKLTKTKDEEGREVALSREVVDAIPPGKGAIFFGHISDRTLRHYLAMACRINGITGRFRIHDGRVTSATEWARKNRDPKASMDQFGWKTEKMAMHYQKVATEERVEQAQNITYR